jgi:NADH-quinone oxidoreductase subunit E
MFPKDLEESLKKKIAGAEHPREMAIDVMVALQNHYGHLNDEALQEAAELLGMTPLELEEVATFYDFIYRDPVGKYVIHVCDGVVCWMNGDKSVIDYLCTKLGVQIGETTSDGLFTVLPTACLGYCDLSPAMLIGRRAFGPLTPEKIDDILQRLRDQAEQARMGGEV